jgi:hypothetical protein
MAVFYQVISEIKRGTFTCAVATAAYRSGSNLTLELFDKNQSKIVSYSFDYSKKTGIVFSAIIAPAHTPKCLFDRQILWQTVEDRETKYNSYLATEFTIALPEELTTEQNIELIKEFAQTSFVERGMIADVNFHNEHQNNPHLHIMCPTRVIGGKDRGGKLLTKEKGWNTKATINAIKQEQAQIINKYLKKYGHESRISELPDNVARFDCLRPWL